MARDDESMYYDYNFSFVLPGRLAGMAFPGRGDDLTDALIELALRGVRALVSLTPRPLDRERLQQAGFSYLHVPLHDFTPPTARQIDDAVAFWREQDKQGRGTVFHCMAGVGRTGTLLACVLVAEGWTADAAIREVRRLRPGSIETEEQEDAVIAYARRKPPPAPPPAGDK